jgi:hypothetical protein
VASHIFAIKARSLLVEWNTARLHSRLRSGLKYKHKTILKKLAKDSSLFWLTISDESKGFDNFDTWSTLFTLLCPMI